MRALAGSDQATCPQRNRALLLRYHRDALAIKVDRGVDDMTGRLGRAPTPAELAQATGMSLEQVLEGRESLAARHAVSLDRPLSAGGDDGATHADLLGEEDAGYAAAEARATIARLLGGLSAQEREVIRLRFQEDLTQAEIGARFGISQMRVSRMIREVLGRLHEEAVHSEQSDQDRPESRLRPWPPRSTARPAPRRREPT